MDANLIIRKVEAEKDVAPSFGIYRLYSFLMKLTNDPNRTRRIMIHIFGYSKTDATNVASRYNYHNRTKA